WSTYFERLNVAAAGGDLPDVFAQQERFVAEYASRGLLADLGALDIATDQIDDAVLHPGFVDETLVAIPTGVSAHALAADPAVFAAAGVDLPDDLTWTWADFEDVTRAIHKQSDGEYWGVQSYGFAEEVLKIVARQHDGEMFTADGEIGVSRDVIRDWFQRALDQVAAGAEPPAPSATEIEVTGVEGSLPATGRGAMAWFWSNQLDAIERAAGRDLVLLRPPGESDHVRSGAYLYPTQYYSVAATSAHPEEAALLVDFLVNSTQAGEIIRTDRGLPANNEVREAVLPLLSGADRVSADFVIALAEDVLDGSTVPPVGSGEVQQITQRITSDLLFGRITSEQAADRWLDEVGRAVS
ncbi:MAG: ABC transporter substrate-binding protein, partial [Propionicimonas sp.]